jgi:hypothetical protein
MYIPSKRASLHFWRYRSTNHRSIEIDEKRMFLNLSEWEQSEMGLKQDTLKFRVDRAHNVSSHSPQICKQFELLG